MSRPATVRSAPWVGLSAALLLAVAAVAVPAAGGWRVGMSSLPPLQAAWGPRVGPGTLPAVALAVLAAWQGVPLAARLPWGWLLVTTYAAGAGWLLALAFVDGSHGISDVLTGPHSYLPTARETTDLHATLQEYVSRIPFSAAPDNWPVHVAGHPPGALTFFVLLVRLGLGGGVVAGTVVTLIAASTAVAVLVTVRALGSPAAARRAAPFVTLGPAALFQAVSADAVFAAVAAWGVAALALAAARRAGLAMVAWSVLAGLLLGYTAMLSYGLPLLGVLALTVLALARSWRPLGWSLSAAVAVVLAYAARGFVWWQALPVLHERYWAGAASGRPAAYWAWGNLAALVLSAGPVVGAGLACALVRLPRRDVAAMLACAGFVMVLLADASQMSRAEVERIWLPFVPWLLVSCALLPLRWRRRGLALQLVSALLIQHLVRTAW